jgi:hypothetical protein
MTWATRPLLATTTLALALGTGGAAAQAAPQPGASCAKTPSAINQYCENIPSATGGSLPPPGTPGPAAATLGTALPQSAVRRYQHLPAAAQKRARKLLALPAPAASVPLSASISTRKSAWSLPTGLLVAMVAMAIAGAGAAIARHRRRTGPPSAT